MLQAKCYSLSSLVALNGAYDKEHHLRQEDVDHANRLVRLIEGCRSEDRPCVGDRILYTTRYGDFYPHALVEKEIDGGFMICGEPYVPFVHPSGDGIALSVSGGPFFGLAHGTSRFAGWGYGDFKDWGHCGPCGNGAVTFEARVGYWKYKEPDPIYSEFSTESWRRVYLRRSRKADEDLYTGKGISFRDEAEFQRFLHQFEGTVFPGSTSDQIVVWCFRERLQGVSRRKWEALEGPVEGRRIYNKVQEVKIVKNSRRHESICYYVLPGLPVL